ncbi:hypothetical protein H5410_056357, partial [Solanum commersonii]
MMTPKCIYHKTFREPSNGYLVNDRCAFGVDVCVIKNHGVGDANENGQNISIFLELVHVNGFDSQKRVQTTFSISIKDQFGDVHRKLTTSTGYWFATPNFCWGWAEFLPLSELKDPKKCFIVIDCCIVEAYISVLQIVIVAEFIVAGGNYMRTIVPIALHRNGSYDDMISSVIQAGELACEPGNLMINYQMTKRVKIHPAFIKNDWHVSLYLMNIDVDGSRPILRINIIARSPIEPTDSFNDNDSVGNENLGDQPNESFCDQSNDNLVDDSLNGHDHSLDVEDQPVDFEHFEVYQGEPELRSQPSHSFPDGTNFYMSSTIIFFEFKDKSPKAAFVLEHDVGFEKWSR